MRDLPVRTTKVRIIATISPIVLAGACVMGCRSSLPNTPILMVPNELVVLEGSSAQIGVNGSGSEPVKLSTWENGSVVLSCDYAGVYHKANNGECAAEKLQGVSVEIVKASAVPDTTRLEMGAEHVRIIAVPRVSPSSAPPSEVSWIEPGTGRTGASNLAACVTKQKTYVAFSGNVGSLICGPPLTCSWIEDSHCGAPHENATAKPSADGATSGIVSIKVQDEVGAGSGTTVVCLGSTQQCSLPGHLLLVKWSSDNSGGCQ